jgi:hypothetical protein
MARPVGSVARVGWKPARNNGGKHMNDEYEAPKAIRLNDADRAFGTCSDNGSTVAVGYRVNDFDGVCVTGKSANSGCHTGSNAG